MGKKKIVLTQEHTAFNATVYGDDYYNHEPETVGIVIDVNNGYSSRGSLSLTIDEAKQVIEVINSAISEATKLKKKIKKNKEAK